MAYTTSGSPEGSRSPSPVNDGSMRPTSSRPGYRIGFPSGGTAPVVSHDQFEAAQMGFAQRGLLDLSASATTPIGHVPPDANVFWFSGQGVSSAANSLASEDLGNIRTFALMNPHWKLHFWTDDDSAAFKNLPVNVEVKHWEAAFPETMTDDERLIRNYIELTRSAVPVSAADIMKVLVLKPGGVSFDVDVKWKGPVQSGFKTKNGICLHGGGENALIAVPKGSTVPAEFLRKAARALRKEFNIVQNENGTETWTVKNAAPWDTAALVNHVSVDLLHEITMKFPRGSGDMLSDYANYECRGSKRNWVQPGWTGGTVSRPASQVHELDRGAFLDVVGKFQESLARWKPSRESAPHLQSRLSATNELTRRMYLGAAANTHPDTQGFATYFRDGTPFGLMTARQLKDHVIVDEIVAHPDPASRGTGRKLIEAAVNYSERNGLGGHVRLQAYEGAEPAYVGMGFEKGLFDMSLDPAKSDAWEKKGSLWQLKS